MSDGVVTDRDRLTAQERAAIITARLRCGERLLSRQIAEITGLTRMGAWHLMNNLSRVLPIAQDDEGCWYWIT